MIDRRCATLIKGFQGGYCYRRMQVSGERYDDKPEKNMYSHIHDALQYMMLGCVKDEFDVWTETSQSFQCKKGFDILEDRLIIRKVAHFGIDYKEIRYVFWWWW
ncbi:MAG: hypothetical protein CM15mV81_280 [uncultured marine virus]|nr:MAG: hypothetical protein CM15mV81_280 [uncultured marine virus]